MTGRIHPARPGGRWQVPGGQDRQEMNWLQRPVAAPFIQRLQQAPGFGSADLASLAALNAELRSVEANTIFMPEGPRGGAIHVLLDGWAARFKILENGSRQIPALLLPGDVCDIDALHLDRLDWGTVALTRGTVAAISRDKLTALIDRQGGVRAAIGRMAAVDHAVATQWTVCLGRRSARERLAHLLCELFARLHAVRAAGNSGFTLPLTQEEIADVLGLTAVHVNRTLQTMRSQGLIQLRDHRLYVPDLDALRRLAGFDGLYLHLPDEDIAPKRDRAEGSADPACAAA